MATAEEKFKKLIAAYEDEVQRKQHKMGKRIEPTDVAQPNPSTGICNFLRGGSQIVWHPSFDVIGTWESTANRWTWGWADQTYDARVRSRIDEVRRQGQSWGIDPLTVGILPAASEQEAWEFAIVATAVMRADAMYRMVEGSRQRFLALFDGPPPTRSNVMRAVSSDSLSAVGPMSTPARTSSGTFAAVVPPSSSASSSNLARTVPAGTAPMSSGPMSGSGPRTVSSGSMRSPSFSSEGGPEPTSASRAEVGSRLLEAVPYLQQQNVQSITALVRASAPAGPVGSVALEISLSMQTRQGAAVTLNVTPGLHNALSALWHRCRERNGTPYRSLRAHLEGGATTLDLEM